MNKDKGFTLIELLIVIAVIAILAAAVIITISPGEQLAKARDATRERHVKALESALYVYQYDNGVFPTGITSTLTEICNTNQIDPTECDELTDISSLVEEGHMSRIPIDPNISSQSKGWISKKLNIYPEICVY
jgi:prepilin-type N-terminal cleavage/methylation domain-containing protein